MAKLPAPDPQASSLLKLAVICRSAQMMAHNFHNLCSGETFFSDHSFMGDLYGTYEEIYDGLIERLIGTGVPPDLVKVQQFAIQRLSQVPGDTDAMFQQVQSVEEEIRQVIEEAAASNQLSQGVLNTLAGIADDSEVRSYKIKQRLA